MSSCSGYRVVHPGKKRFFFYQIFLWNLAFELLLWNHFFVLEMELDSSLLLAIRLYFNQLLLLILTFGLTKMHSQCHEKKNECLFKKKNNDCKPIDGIC